MGGLSAGDDHFPPTSSRPGALQPPRAPVFCDQNRWPRALLHAAASATKANPSPACINYAKVHLSSSQPPSTPFPLLLCSLPLTGSQRRRRYSWSAPGTLLVSPATRSTINLHCSFKTLSFNLVLPFPPPQLTDLLVYIP